MIEIVMDYASGGDISQRINRQKMTRKPFAIDKVMTWIAQACKALFYLHRQGKIHRFSLAFDTMLSSTPLNISFRDIKAANMFLSSDDNLLLGDFGIGMAQNLRPLYAW